MSNKGLLILTLYLLIVSCSPQRRLQSVSEGEQRVLEEFCDSLTPYKTLYINKIKAEITLDEENYDARVSIYYIPDSLFFISAINAGFEIVRIGVTKDSMVYINRLEKMVFIHKVSALGYPPPVAFEDFELLINRAKLCGSQAKNSNDSEYLVINLSGQDIGKELSFSKDKYSLMKFEFFQKKTSEYIVGEQTGEGEFLIYSNYILDNLMLKTSGGIVEYNREIDINLDFNRNKYESIYF